MGSRVARIGFWIKIILFYFTFSFCTFGNHQGWEFALLLITLLLKIAHYKELLWANCSGRSPKMINHERFALRSLTKNERPWVNRSGHSWQKSNLSESLWFFWVNCSFAHKKRVIHSKIFTKTGIFCKFTKNKHFAHSLFFKAMWAMVRLLTKNKQLWANRSPKMSNGEGIAHQKLAN